MANVKFVADVEQIEIVGDAIYHFLVNNMNESETVAFLKELKIEEEINYHMNLAEVEFDAKLAYIILINYFEQDEKYKTYEQKCYDLVNM